MAQALCQAALIYHDRTTKQLDTIKTQRGYDPIQSGKGAARNHAQRHAEIFRARREKNNKKFDKAALDGSRKMPEVQKAAI
jgi:hypothetical protein